MTNTERINITLPSDWREAWSKAAEQDGKTLSAWIGECCNAKLPRVVKKELSERRSVGKPKKD